MDLDNLDIKIENGTYELGACICCGKTIAYSIFGKCCFNWFCKGDQINSPCVNYGNDFCKSKCKLKEKKKEREKYQRIIREIILTMIDKYGYMKFIGNSEIFKAIEPKLDLLNIYKYPIKDIEQGVFMAEYKEEKS